MYLEEIRVEFGLFQELMHRKNFYPHNYQFNIFLQNHSDNLKKGRNEGSLSSKLQGHFCSLQYRINIDWKSVTDCMVSLETLGDLKLIICISDARRSQFFQWRK